MKLIILSMVVMASLVASNGLPMDEDTTSIDTRGYETTKPKAQDVGTLTLNDVEDALLSEGILYFSKVSVLCTGGGVFIKSSYQIKFPEDGF